MNQIFSDLKDILQKKFQSRKKCLPQNSDQFLSMLLWSQTQTFDPEMIILANKNYEGSPEPVYVSNEPGMKVRFHIAGTKIYAFKAYPLKAVVVSDGQPLIIDRFIGVRKILFDFKDMSYSNIVYKLIKKETGTKTETEGEEEAEVKVETENIDTITENIIEEELKSKHDAERAYQIIRCEL